MPDNTDNATADQLKVLMLSTDKKIFAEDSRVRARQAEYGRLCDRLHIVIPAGSCWPETDQLAENVWAHAVQWDNKFFAWFGIIRLALKIIREHSFRPEQSLVTTQDAFEVGLAGWIISVWSGLSLNLQVHTDISSEYFSGQSWRRWSQTKLAGFLLPRADTIRVVSARVKEYLRSKLEIRDSKIFTLPVYTDAQEIQAKAQANNSDMPADKTLVIVSRLEKEKGVAHAVKALAPLLRHPGDVNLLIVGDGGQRQKLERLVTKLGIPHAVELLGWQENPLPYMANAYLTIVPSYYEGWGMVAVESLLAGTPVVMTDVGAAGEVVTEATGGKVVPVGDQQALRAAVEELIVDERSQEELASRTEAIVDRINTRDQYLDNLQTIWYKTIQSS